MKSIISIVGFTFIMSLITGCGTSTAPSDGNNFRENLSKIITGRVIDYDGKGIPDVKISIDKLSATTDNNGLFKLNNVERISDMVYLKAEKQGYFTKYYKTTRSNNATLITIVLKEKQLTRVFNSKDGIKHFYPNGSSITIPSNSLVVESSKQMYTGDVYMYSYSIEGGNDDMANNFPGDFSARNSNGENTNLFTHGIQTVELFSSDGKKLNLADNKKAKLSFPVPDVLQGQYPDEFPIWHFNPTNGLWEETGIATLKGGFYETEVSHFSTVNLDYPSLNATIVVTVVDCDNKPLSGVTVELLSKQGTTSDNGTITFIRVPTRMAPNAPSILNIRASGLLNGYLTSNTVTINNLQPNETRNVTIKLQATTLTGRLVDCKNNPITGMVTASWGQKGFSYGYTDGNGIFKIAIPSNTQVRISYPLGKTETISVPSGCNSFTVGEIKIDPNGNDCNNSGGGGIGNCSLIWSFQGKSYNANDYKYQGQTICVTYISGRLFIRGMVSDNHYEGLSINANVGGTGTFEIGRPEQEPANATLILPGGVQAVSYYVDRSSGNIDLKSARGELIIEEFTSSVIKGRFTCNLHDGNGISVGIVSGSFSLSR